MKRLELTRARFHLLGAAALCAAGLFTSVQAQNSANGARPPDLATLTAELARQTGKAERDLAQGRELLQNLARNPVLNERQAAAERTVATVHNRAKELVAAANGSGAAATAARQSLSELLAQPKRNDSASTGARPARLPLMPPRAPNSSRADPAPEDLQATLDAPITPAIQAKADELQRKPVAVFEWVRKNIAFVPSSGSLQGAQGTLDSRRGNATDTASLLVALLRASGVHARYVSGNVELDAERLKRWLGVDRIEAVTELFTEGGVRFETVLSGGQVGSVRFEHVWVETWIDFAPSRGAQHRTGDAWVGLDASYKDLDYQPGVDFAVPMALDVVSAGNAINASATINSNEAFLSALGADVLAAQLAAATERLRNALRAQNLADARLGDLLPRANDATPAYPFFLGNLAYNVLGHEIPVAVLPDGVRHRLRWILKSDDNGIPGPDAIVLDQPTVALAGKNIDLRFVPASADDRLALTRLIPATLGAFGDLPDAIPAYLIRMQAELWLDDTRLAQSPALNMGHTLHAQLVLRAPSGLETRTLQTAFVGEQRALALDWHGGSPALLTRSVDALRAAQQALSSGASVAVTSLTGHVLRVGGVGHHAASGAYQAWLAGLNKTSFHRAPSNTSAYAALEVAAPMGILTSVHPAGLGLSDVSPRHLGAALQNGNEARFARQSLAAQASFGHLLLQQLYTGTGRSAARVFAESLAANKRIYTFDATRAGMLANLNLPAPVAGTLQAALAAGDTVTVTGQAQAIAGWTGYGAQIDYAAARGGTSFVFGTSRSDVNTDLTGANVSTPVARGVAFTGWLGEEAPDRLIDLWLGELEPVIAGGIGLIGIAQNPLDVGMTERIEQLVAGTVLDQLVGPRVDPLVSQHLWTGLVGPVLSIAPLLDPLAPVVTLAVDPLAIELGQSARIRASATDNKGVVSLIVTAAGAPLTLSNDEILYTPTRAGVIPIVARARDAAGNLDEEHKDLLVRAPGDATPPVVEITSPLDDAEVTKPVDVIGSVTDESLRSWTLAMRPGNSPEATPMILGQGDQSVTNGVLGKFDPTLLMNGVYILILHAEDVGGAVSDASVQVRVTGDMKVGHFAITFEEVEVPLYGIPIKITRTYDTRQANEKLDFGHGWSVDYQNVRLRESRKLGYSWRLAQNGGGFAPFCVKPAGSPTVTINLPDGETAQFRAKWSPECQQFMPPVYGNLVFEPVDERTSSKLEQTDYGQLRIANIAGGASDLIDLDDPGNPVDPQHYKLTTAEGMVYFLDQKFGIQRIVDPAGNTITYTPAGVVHSSGTRIDFVRDSQKRITDIVLPDGRRLKYRYDAAGDLIEAKDAGGLATTFGYLPSQRWPHYLQDIIDPRGVRGVRQEYNDEGRLVATIDADGQRMEYVHNIAGRTETIKNRRGYSTTYVYDENGWVLSETNALNQQTVRTYNANGDELTRKDPLNRITTMGYDPRGNMLTETNPANETTTRTWNYYNALVTQTDGLNRLVAKNQYYRNSLTGEETQYVTVSENGAGEKTYFGLDLGQTSGNTGDIKSITDATGAITRFNYDTRGNLNSDQDAAGATTTRVHDAMGRVIKETRQRTVNGQAENLVSEFSYDGKGQLIQTKHPDGSVTKNTYNAIGKIETATDGLNRVTRYAYDNRGNQTRITYPDGLYEEKTFDPEGNVVAQRDRAGRVTTMVYDAVNRLIETIHPDDTDGDDSDNPRIENEYDAAGQLVATTDERDQRTEYRYDAAGRRTHVIDALSKSTETVYDAAGRRSIVIDALGRRTKFVYDAANRVSEIIHADATPADDADNPRTKHAYDGAGHKVAETDELGRMTRFTYDKAGRLTQVILPNPSTGVNPDLVDGQSPISAGTLVTKYGYDEQGSKVSQTDAEGRITRWSYDAMGRLVSRTLPLGQVETLTYDAAGQRTRHVTFNQAEIATAYDSLGRVEALTFPQNRARRFQYTATSQVREIDDAGSIYRFDYDVRDRLVHVEDASARAIDYRYDAASNRTELKTARQLVSYVYDALNRLKDVIASRDGATAQTTSYTYDDVGNRSTQVNPNGTTVTYAYNPRNRLTSILHKAAAGTLLLGLNYSVDPVGLRTELKETQGTTLTRTTTWTYDKVKRLTNEAVVGIGSPSPNRNSAWTYDKVGNRKTESTSGSISKSLTYTYDTNDRLLKEQGSPATYDYSYDNAGNLKDKKQGTTVLASYGWDEENRLVTATLGAAGPAQQVASYRYDPNGIRRRQEVTASSTTTRTEYLVDPNQTYAQVLEDWTATGPTANPLPASTLQTVYVHGDDLIAQTRLALDGSVKTSQYHYDGLGSTRFLSATSTDASNGTVTDRYAYTAFGEADARGSNGTTANSYLYTGEQFDPNLGFYNLRARYMDPKTGRFAGMDSYPGVMGDPSTLHKYLYVSNNPVLYVDPSGNMLLVGLDLGGLFTNIGRSISASTARITANRIAGKALERFVEAQLQRFVAQYGGTILRQVYFKGPGGVRFADFVLQVGNRFVAIEVKTNFPLAGRALVRLAGQIRTYLLGANAAVPGTAAEVIVVTEESAAILEASYLAVESQIAGGTLSGVLNGTTQFMMALRAILIGL